MPRFFIEIAYDGSDYSGWQIQPNAVTIQEKIQWALHVLKRENIEIVGCGRTDTGVHASQYFFHMDVDTWNADLDYKANAILPKDIVWRNHFEVDENNHARFDAVKRSYTYFMHGKRDPFKHQYSSFVLGANESWLNPMNEVAQLIMQHKSFFPFCKSNHDAKTLLCDISQANWRATDTNTLEFHITANRFLRGMVRLIVGSCIQVVQGNILLSEIEQALYEQYRLKRSYSAPANGLFLSAIQYPFI